MASVLAAGDIDRFIEVGHVTVRAAFPREIVGPAVDRVWDALPVGREDRTTWNERIRFVREVFHDEPFASAWSARVCGAVDQLLGAGRWHPFRGQGWWPVVFPGFHRPPWRAPEHGWHVDGQHFHHHIDAADQGLLPIFLWSDIAPGGGGTAIAEGSHAVTARILAEHEPAGLSASELAALVAAEPRPSVVECTGEAGDVVLLHPFMLHANSPNTGDAVRFITNPCLRLREPMQLTPPRSPVERAIAAALR